MYLITVLHGNKNFRFEDKCLMLVVWARTSNIRGWLTFGQFVIVAATRRRLRRAFIMRQHVALPRCSLILMGEMKSRTVRPRCWRWTSDQMLMHLG